MPSIPNTIDILRDTPSHPAIPPPITRFPHFTLDFSGVAGFFGGPNALAGMATVNIMPYRKGGGWYNAPGSYEIAKEYGPLANTRIWDGLFPGGTNDPAELFGLDGTKGPQFLAAYSGTNMRHTGHLAYLMGRKADRMKLTESFEGRGTSNASVTIIKLQHVPAPDVLPKLEPSCFAFLCLIPIFASIAACVGCALVADWYCFACILIGIIANGCSCLVVGSGKLRFKHPTPAPGAPRGDGILKMDNHSLVVLRGPEGAVNSLTRGSFYLQYGDDDDARRASQKEGSAEQSTAGGASARQPNATESLKRAINTRPSQSRMGPCAALLLLQFLAQLLLIPQTTLFGQVMFVSSLAVSWGYNMGLAMLDREDIQTEILMNILKITEADNMEKFALGSWTATVVFAILALLSSGSSDESSQNLLNELLPNNTKVWQRWKGVVLRKLANGEKLEFTEAEESHDGLDEKEKDLLDTLIGDAKHAYTHWIRVSQTKDSRQSSSV